MLLKPISIVILFLAIFTEAEGQNGYTALSISTGMSAFNSKYFTITIQNSNSKKIQGGIILEALLYDDFSNSKYNYTAVPGKRYYAVGYYLTSILNTSRNYSSNILYGAALASNSTTVIIYPFASLVQQFNLNANRMFFISEKIQYLIPYQFTGITQHWQPSLNAGFKFLF